MNEVNNPATVKHILLHTDEGVALAITVGPNQYMTCGMPHMIVSDNQAEVLAKAAEAGITIVGAMDLPEEGHEVTVGYYKYGDKLVYCRQDHQRTIFAPEDTPALFYFVRENPEGAEWIEQEMVSLNDIRTRNAKTWKVLQPHVTQAGWEPENTPALWQEVVVGGEVPVWVQPTGGHDAYNIGDEVMFPDAEGTHYRSLINGNVWSPTAYPAGWEEVV